MFICYEATAIKQIGPFCSAKVFSHGLQDFLKIMLKKIHLANEINEL